MTEDRKRRPRNRHRPPRKIEPMDEQVAKMISIVEQFFSDSMEPMLIREMNAFQRKQLYGYYEKTDEFQIKSYKEDDEVILRVYPVGKLKRLAEEKMQLVLMNGKPEALPPMGSFERFIIHSYLKDREGVRTESVGERGKDRHIEIQPLFGRSPKKAKRRLI